MAVKSCIKSSFITCVPFLSELLIASDVIDDQMVLIGEEPQKGETKHPCVAHHNKSDNMIPI